MQLMGGVDTMGLSRSRDSIIPSIQQTDAEVFEAHQHILNIVVSLDKELARMKELIDTSKGRIDSKSQWKGKSRTN
jgi:hypothetical protein